MKIDPSGMGTEEPADAAGGMPEANAVTIDLNNGPSQDKPKESLKTYEVKSGETFNSISKKFGLDPYELAEINNLDITNPNQPALGTVLKLPGITKARLDQIEKNYEAMIASARKWKADVAADNLERFLSGEGGIKELDSNWLKQYEAVKESMEVIQGHFENALNNVANGMEDGETVNGSGAGKSKNNQYWWQAKIDSSMFTELFVASGDSQLAGIGEITLTREGDKVSISGTITYKFSDPYDWTPGDSAYVPGYGVVKDSDAILLQEFRGAKEFVMESEWQQKFTGTIEVGILWNSKNFNWK